MTLFEFVGCLLGVLAIAAAFWWALRKEPVARENTATEVGEQQEEAGGRLKDDLASEPVPARTAGGPGPWRPIEPASSGRERDRPRGPESQEPMPPTRPRPISSVPIELEESPRPSAEPDLSPPRRDSRVNALDRGAGDPGPAPLRLVPEPGPPVGRSPVAPARTPESQPNRPVARMEQSASDNRVTAPQFRHGEARRATHTQPASLRWCGKGKTVTFGSFVLNDPLVYLSKGRPGTMRRRASTSASRSGGPPPNPGGAWATTRSTRPSRPTSGPTTSAGSRAAAWRRLDDIGYAFLYFYGLERRLLVEQQDLSPIVKEVVRLLETYTFSGSFDGYLSRFLSYTLARAGIGTLKDKWFEAVFEKTRAQRDEQHLTVGLAWLFSRDQPLPARWALRIARLDPRAPRSVVLDRLPDQFRELFVKRYREQFGDGMPLKVSKRNRDVTYRPASPSLLDLSRASEGLKPVSVPNVMGIQSQFKPLIDIWSGCIEELKPLSRVMAKGAEVLTREAFEALPDDLKPGVEHPDKLDWDRVTAENAREEGAVLVAAGQLATIHGIPKKAKLTPRQSESLARTAHHVGFVIEPDVRVTNRPYGWDEVVALLRPEESPELPKDSRYAGASLMLELGLFVASADGIVEDKEVDHITRFLESQFLLDPPDARRLEALKQVLMSRTPSLTGVGKRLQAVLTVEQREAIGLFLVGVAAANGTIDRKEITALRSAYKALGVDVGILNQLLDEFRRAMREPVEVYRPTSPPQPGEAIPPRPDGGAAVTLDENLLRRILGETHEVARMLGEAMREIDPDESEPAITDIPVEPLPPPPPPLPPVTDRRFEGLDLRYHSALAELLTRTVWSKGDFEELVRRHSLMPSGTLDVVNEWAQDRLDDLIIEDGGDGLTVNTSLITERP